MSVSYRAMNEADLRPAFDLQMRSFVDLDRRRGETDVPPPPDPAIALVRFRRLLETDPAGAWVAERDGALAGGEANVLFMTARQQWAIDVCVEARLELEPNCGCVFTGGDVGPFAPYLPSGAYL